MRDVKYIIQFDHRGKYGIRVCTVSGFCVGYFSHFDAAVEFCNSN